MRTALSVVVAVLIFSPAAAFGESMTLDEALERAGKSSPLVLAADAAVDSASGDVMQATGYLLPQVNLSETYSRTDDPVGVFAAKLQQGKFSAADFNIGKLNHPGSVNNWQTRIEAGMPIIHSGVIWGKRKAALEAKKAAGQMSEHTVSDVRLMVSRLYYQAAALARQLQTIDDGIGKLRELENSYQLMDAPNSAATTNYYVAKSVRTNLEAERVKIDCMRKDAIRNLNAIMGEDPEKTLELADPLPSVTSLSSSAGEVSTRKDVQAAESQWKAAVQARKAAMRSFGPAIDVFGAYNRYTGDFKSSEGSYEFGARLSIPVFTASKFGEVKKAKADALRAKYGREALALQAEAERQSAEQEFSSCVQRYRTIGDAAGYATEAMRVAGTRYKEGTLPLMDYSQAIQNWVQMRMRHIESHMNVAMAKANLAFQRNEL